MGTLKATRLRSTAQRSVMLVIGQKSEWADPGIEQPHLTGPSL